MKAAAQVGLFVVVAVALFFGALLVVGKALLPTKTDTYLVVMPDAGGLSKGARVLMAGVQVGEVDDVQVDTPTQAKLRIGLKKGLKLPLSTRAIISGSLVGLGDTPLNLVQDDVYRGPAGYLTPGMTIQGGKAGPLDDILPNGGKELYTSLNETLRSVRLILEDRSFKGDVHRILATSNQTLLASQNTLQAFTRLANQSSTLLNANQAEIAQILRTAEGTLSSVHETALSVERYAKGGKLQNGADRLLADAHRIAVQSQSLLEDIHRTLNDPKLNADLRTATGNLAATSERLPGLVDKTQGIANNVESLTAKSQDLPEKLGNVLDNAADLEKRLSGLTERFGGVLGNKPKGIPPITAQIDLLRTNDPGYWRTDLNLSVPLSDGFVTAGLWDAFGRNRLNLQLGKTVNPKLDYRYGIYSARPGVGVDYRLTSKLGFRGDLWDINNPRLDARFRYEFGGGLIGWLGVDGLFDDPAFLIGVGVRR